MAKSASYNLRLRTRLLAGVLTVTPEPPLPGSDCFTRLDRVVGRWAKEASTVRFDMRFYRSFDSRNLMVILALCRLFRDAGVDEFTMHHIPKRGLQVLDALGFAEFIRLPAAV